VPKVLTPRSTREIRLRAQVVRQGLTQILLVQRSAQSVLLEHHHELAHHHAHKHKQAVRKDRTTPQSDLRARYAWWGHILIQQALLSAQNVLSDRHRQLAHRHAHPVRKVLTPLRPAQCAHHAHQGHTRVVLDRRHAHHV
jgi:hypothetical protein